MPWFDFLSTAAKIETGKPLKMDTAPLTTEDHWLNGHTRRIPGRIHGLYCGFPASYCKPTERTRNIEPVAVVGRGSERFGIYRLGSSIKII
jgi:hypothetical protein